MEKDKKYTIGNLNSNIEELYLEIKNNGEFPKDFELDIFLQQCKKILDGTPEDNGKEEDNILADLLNEGPEDVLNAISRDLDTIKLGIKEIQEGFHSKKEVFLNFNIGDKEVSLSSLTFNIFKGYLGGYYFLALKLLIILWKNEVNLYDESMSFHHINKSLNDIKKVLDFLDNQLIPVSNMNEGQVIFKEISGYASFLLSKWGKTTYTSKDYSEYIKIQSSINQYEQYEKEDDQKTVEEIMKKIFGGKSNFETISFENDKELYIFFRYIKDVKYLQKPLKAYQILKKSFENYSKRGKSYLYKSENGSFFINNLISLLNQIICANDLSSFNYTKEIQDIENFFEENGFSKTYFTYFKYAQLYKNLGKKEKKKDFFEKAGKSIESAIKIFDKNDGAYYPFYVTSELFIESNIFSYTTFIIPSKTDYAIKLKKEQLKIIEEKHEYIIDRKLTSFQEKINENNNVIEKKFHNSNIKTIEILAVFSAIVLFASSSVQVFQYLPTVKSVFSVIIGFAFCLISFVLLIFILIGEKKDLCRHIIVFFILLISSLIFGWASGFLITEKDNILINKEYKEKIKDEILDDIRRIEQINQVPTNIINQKIEDTKLLND